jgi:tRNA pseudouridine(38-40) synthase
MILDTIPSQDPSQKLTYSELQREKSLFYSLIVAQMQVVLSHSQYSGMQINPNVASIELDLHKALAASGAVSQENAMDPNKSQFMRCARTDKGVHAGGQVVSLKIMILDNVIAKINEILRRCFLRVW